MSDTDRINYSIQKKNIGSNPERAEFIATRSTEVITNPNEYEAQVKSFRLETNNIMFNNITGLQLLSISLVGGADTSFFQQPLAPNEIRSPYDYTNAFNFAVLIIMNSIRANNPSFTGGILSLNPFLTFDTATNRFLLFVPDYTAPFSVIITFSPEINKCVNFYTLYTPTASLSTNEQNYGMVQSKDQSTTLAGNLYYFYKSKGVLNGFSNIDSIRIQSSMVPVAPTFEGETNDIKNIVLKIYKPNIDELLNEEIIVNYTTDNYFSMNSHYPVKSIDIQFIIRYKDGTELPFEIYPANAFSCELEFKRLERF